MAFSYLEPDNLKDVVRDSKEYMRPFFEPLVELERLSRGKPGKIPKGKPRVTDGTLAGVRRETPKRIIQQIPTGKVTIKSNPELEQQVNAVLTDIILPNANSGGTPYAKSKEAIKDVFPLGASAAYCFYNRRGNIFSADFRRIHIRDLGFEKGKTSEFDTNVMVMDGWYTPMDIKAIIWQQQELIKSSKDFKPEWDLKVLQALLDAGVSEKDDQNKTDAEKKQAAGTNGYIHIAHLFQIGVGAKFYSYSPLLDKVAKTTTSKDPRGIIPIHLLVPEEDSSSPIGEPLLSISAGKQNLLDFDMQMYQYSRGLQLSPPVKKWGSITTSAIKLVPDAVIDMGGNKTSGNDFETVDINNSAINDYSNNASYIKTQIYNEQGSTTDTSISAEAGASGYSKTSKGVSAQENRLGISDNDLRKCYESWFGRICETLLNIHFAETKGIKELELESNTLKRIKHNSADPVVMNYDQEFGKIKFSVDASTSQAQDGAKENEDLTNVLEITSQYGGLRPDRQMAVVNQIIQNSGVEDAEKLKYTDEEISQARELALNPPPPPVDPNAVPPVDPNVQNAPILPEQTGVDTQPMPEMPMSQNMGEQPLMPEELPMEQAQDFGPELPQENMEQPETSGLDEDEVQTIQLLDEKGYSPDQIATAIAMLRNEYSDEDIMQVLGGPQNG